MDDNWASSVAAGLVRQGIGVHTLDTSEEFGNMVSALLKIFRPAYKVRNLPTTIKKMLELGETLGVDNTCDNESEDIVKREVWQLEKSLNGVHDDLATKFRQE